ncbi:hypothetical protein BDV26DRAFT_261223 [Aspergillus bertholletiae]|uniref:Uncharacterized protein n=1 Tax=Aspergillus bertholletiae TaxID=1226010 RepID=A0A5N7BA39_9EURO|nr:hypothetical protein BDV26DRAFT_261223 [Aspergillus bertholletiae]
MHLIGPLWLTLSILEGKWMKNPQLSSGEVVEDPLNDSRQWRNWLARVGMTLKPWFIYPASQSQCCSPASPLVS